MLSGLKKELESRAVELSGEQINTIYLGGGTPSVLLFEELFELLTTIREHYTVAGGAEITMEANPDDLNPDFLSAIRQIGFNRLSIGIQSFVESELQLMNRRHGALQATQSVEWAKDAGFGNISIDLIYGLPNQTLEDWQANVETALQLNVQHISAYNLTYHKGTVFYERLKKGMLQELPDELSLQQFEVMISLLKEAGFEHYEISNFCKPGYYSRHNSSYWKNEKYLGIGPSAHSFDIQTRRWNVSSISKYLEAIENERPYWESEILSVQDRYNDFIITGLRTSWGILEDEIKQGFPAEFYEHFEKVKVQYLQSGKLEYAEGKVRINSKGLFISDKIMADFMIVEYC